MGISIVHSFEVVMLKKNCLVFLLSYVICDWLIGLEFKVCKEYLLLNYFESVSEYRKDLVDND